MQRIQMLIPRIKEKPLPIQPDFKYNDFCTHFTELKKNGKKEELVSYFEQMIENLKKIFVHDSHYFLDFILNKLDEYTYDFLTDFGIEWFRKTELFNNVHYLTKLLNGSSIKHWNFFLDCVGREWLDTQLDYKKLYALLYRLTDERSLDLVEKAAEGIHARHRALFSYLGQEIVSKKFTPENLGIYIRDWQATSMDQAYYVLLEFLSGGNLEEKNTSNTVTTTWDEKHTQLDELTPQQCIDDKGYFSRADAIGIVLGKLSTVTSKEVFAITSEVLLTQHRASLEEGMPKPDEYVYRKWMAFLKYLKPDWQRIILTTPGQLKALFKGNEHCETELLYLLLMQTRLEFMNVEQGLELMESLSGKFLHSWLLENKNLEQFKNALVVKKDNPFYRVYLYAAAKAAHYEEEHSKDQVSWWLVPKNQRVNVASLLMEAIYKEMPIGYSWGCNNGSSGVVKKLYEEMLNKKLTLTNLNKNLLTSARNFQ